MDGESLRVAEVTTRKAVDLAAQVAAGLAAAHDAGIAHRDLKPENGPQNIAFSHNGKSLYAYYWE